MRIAGSHRFDAPIEAVFDAIHDPATLLAIIPGCQDVHRLSETEYRARLALRLPGLSGGFDTAVRVLEAERPHRSRIAGRVDGLGGSIDGEAVFTLRVDGERTTLDYAGEAVVGGPFGRLDSRFAEGFARSLIDHGLAQLETELRADPAARPVVAVSNGQGSGQ